MSTFKAKFSPLDVYRDMINKALDEKGHLETVWDAELAGLDVVDLFDREVDIPDAVDLVIDAIVRDAVDSLMCPRCGGEKRFCPCVPAPPVNNFIVS